MKNSKSPFSSNPFADDFPDLESILGMGLREIAGLSPEVLKLIMEPVEIDSFEVISAEAGKRVLAEAEAAALTTRHFEFSKAVLEMGRENMKRSTEEQEARRGEKDEADNKIRLLRNEASILNTALGDIDRKIHDLMKHVSTGELTNEDLLDSLEFVLDTTSDARADVDFRYEQSRNPNAEKPMSRREKRMAEKQAGETEQAAASA